MPRNPSKKPAYHHGNLRVALINAGLAIVAEGRGRHGFTACGRPTRRMCRTVLRTIIFPTRRNSWRLWPPLVSSDLVAEIHAEMERIAPSLPIDQLRGLGRTYMNFAAANPSVFRMMFRPELTQPNQHPVLQGAEALAFSTLMEIIVACQQQQQLPAGDPFALAVCAWSSGPRAVDAACGTAPAGDTAGSVRLESDCADDQRVRRFGTEWPPRPPFTPTTQ